MPQVRRTRINRLTLKFATRVAVSTAALTCALGIPGSLSRAQAPPSSEPLVWSTDSVGPRRFIAVPGRRGLISGYANQTLEVWTYPLQVIDGYSLSFRVEGTSSEISGPSILRRIECKPESTTRVYAGPDFVVRERLFVPLDEAGAVITYEVSSPRPLEIQVHFTPVLDLMWPGSVGGQEAIWNATASGYLLAEPTGHYRATITSPDIVAHDDTTNVAQNVRAQPGLSFTLRAGGQGSRIARVGIAAATDKSTDPMSLARKLLANDAALEQQAAMHYRDSQSRVLEITTPDADVNRALQWSQIAMDQFWACNPDLGCDLVGGYGPSRKRRRPQYAWFFAGDSLVGLEALLSESDFSTAKSVLEFVAKYQNPANGMIWHELSQSAGQLDWAGKYPFMYVHVDITFDYLSAWANYIAATGDKEFLTSHWASLEAAYRYCVSTLDGKDGLPRIAADKQGGNEQESLSDDLRLSVAWVDASESFAQLATLLGKTHLAEDARRMNQQARTAISKRYWSEAEHVWITATTRQGKPVIDRREVPASVFTHALFTEAQQKDILDSLASSAFQTDWGTRGVPSDSPKYDPNLYASGSVWAAGTAGTSETFWRQHRPAAAWQIWRALVPWTSLDAIGHMDEALAGDLYHEEEESVPEQMWSSAQFITAAARGMLGITIDTENKKLDFSPHLPPEWGKVSLRNVRVGESLLHFTLSQTGSQIDLDAQNDGPPVSFLFAPEIASGAHDLTASLDHRPVASSLEPHEQDTHARVEIPLPTGASHLSIRYNGGVSIMLPNQPVLVGDPSVGMKLVSAELHDGEYRVKLDRVASLSCSFLIRTPWKIAHVDGASVEPAGADLYRITLAASGSSTDLNYTRAQVVVRFQSTP